LALKNMAHPPAFDFENKRLPISGTLSDTVLTFSQHFQLEHTKLDGSSSDCNNESIGLTCGQQLRESSSMALIDIKTEITGNIWKIVARVGEEINEDAPILIMESMKMEIPVSAPEAGTLREILVAEGDIVTEGTVVARIEA